MKRVLLPTAFLALAAIGRMQAAESISQGSGQVATEVHTVEAQQQEISSVSAAYAAWFQTMISWLSWCGQNKKYFNPNSGGSCD